MALRAIWQLMDWTEQSVNCMLPENTCFIFYVIANLWIKKQLLFKYINKLFY